MTLRMGMALKQRDFCGNQTLEVLSFQLIVNLTVGM